MVCVERDAAEKAHCKNPVFKSGLPYRTGLRSTFIKQLRSGADRRSRRRYREIGRLERFCLNLEIRITPEHG